MGRARLAAIALALGCSLAWAAPLLAQEPGETPPSEPPSAAPEPGPPVEEPPAVEPPIAAPGDRAGRYEVEPGERRIPYARMSARRRARGGDDRGVSILDFEFEPRTVTVTAGGTVTWINDGEANHTATAEARNFDTGELGPGQSATISFGTPGTFPYSCSIHPEMEGTVEVLAGEDTDGGPESDGGIGTGEGDDTAPTEAEAGAGPDAAGTTGRSLPATGSDPARLAIVGLLLTAFGVALAGGYRVDSGRC